MPVVIVYRTAFGECTARLSMDCHWKQAIAYVRERYELVSATVKGEPYEALTREHR